MSKNPFEQFSPENLAKKYDLSLEDLKTPSTPKLKTGGTYKAQSAFMDEFLAKNGSSSTPVKAEEPESTQDEELGGWGEHVTEDPRGFYGDSVEAEDTDVLEGNAEETDSPTEVTEEVETEDDGDTSDDGIAIEHDESSPISMDRVTEGVESSQQKMAIGPISTIDQWVRAQLDLKDGDEPWNRRSELSFGSHSINVFISWALLGFTPTHEVLEKLGFEDRRIEEVLSYLHVLGRLKGGDEEIQIEAPQPVNAETVDETPTDNPSEGTERIETLLALLLSGLTEVEGFPSTIGELKARKIDLQNLLDKLDL